MTVDDGGGNNGGGNSGGGDGGGNNGGGNSGGGNSGGGNRNRSGEELRASEGRRECKWVGGGDRGSRDDAAEAAGTAPARRFKWQARSVINASGG